MTCHDEGQEGNELLCLLINKLKWIKIKMKWNANREWWAWALGLG